MDPLMAEQELRFSVIVQPPHSFIPTTFCTLEEGNLCGGPFYTDSLINALFVKSGEGEGEEELFNLPHSAGHCHVEGSYFIFGGILYRNYLKDSDCNAYGPSSLVISAPSSRPAGPRRVCGRLPEAGIFFLPVPYRGKIYLFGYPGEEVLIYDPQTHNYLRPGSMPESFGMTVCMSYFIWPENQKIMLQYRSAIFDKVKLLSYDVGADCWEEFDPDFPCKNRNENPPLLLPGTDTLLIMDQPDSWRIYNLSNRKLTGETVRVEGMREDLQDPHRGVFASFCRAFSCGSFLVFAFIMGFGDPNFMECPREIAYAKIRLRPSPEGKKEGFVAAVESQGDLMVGQNYGAYIFAEPSTKRKGSPPL